MKIECCTQTETCKADRPKLRIIKKQSSDAIKFTCSKLSSICGVSLETSGKAVQVLFKNLYDHVYRTPVEQLEGKQETFNQEKHIINKKAPVTAEQYENYSFVLPSIHTKTDYKQCQSSQMKKEAANHLLNKESNVKATVHFDSTSHSTIDGEWPSLIIIFSNSQEFRLRPLLFAYEDQDQITELFVETLKRLSVSANLFENVSTTPATMWEKVNSLMTDPVKTNLGIEGTIPNALGSSHHPCHLLCKSHTVEALDCSNLNVRS